MKATAQLNDTVATGGTPPIAAGSLKKFGLELAQYRTLIENMPVKEQASVSKMKTWRKHKSQELSAVLNDFGNDDGTTVSVSRRDVFDLASQGITPHFVYATYIWGYPNGNRGKYKHVSDQMDTILEHLQGVPNRVDEGNWQTEYGKLTGKISDVGLSTWTKLLYFLRMQIGGRPALILDGKIIEVFGRRVFCEFGSLAEIRYDTGVQRYVEYLRSMYDAAASLDVDAAKLEMFLFTFGNSLKN